MNLPNACYNLGDSITLLCKDGIPVEVQAVWPAPPPFEAISIPARGLGVSLTLKPWEHLPMGTPPLWRAWVATCWTARKEAK